MSNDEPDDRDDPGPDETESGEAGEGQPPVDDDQAGDSDDSWVSDSVDEGESATGDSGPGGSETGSVDDGPDHDTGSGSVGSSASGGKGPNEKFCAECGAVINEKAEICPECGVRQPGMDSGNDERIVAALLAILLGSFGAHKFYLGNNKLGVIYLCFFWTGIPGIIGIIEGVIYLTKDDDEFRRQYMDE
jgi:TM2 domain-containing membrane protein YozV